MKIVLPILLLLLKLFGFSAVFADVATVGSVKMADTIAANGFNPQGYYIFRDDLRKCVSPMCGGFFVKAVNQGLTRCADGTLQIECYVASFNNKNSLDLSLATLVRGDIKPKKYRGFGNLGIFVVAEAYRPAMEGGVTEIGSESIFVGLENNSIVCITTPCFSVDQYLLNRKKIRTISDINLNGVGASKALLDQALSIMSTGGVLIASGIDQQTKGVGGKGVAFVADQFYLPVEPVK